MGRLGLQCDSCLSSQSPFIDCPSLPQTFEWVPPLLVDCSACGCRDSETMTPNRLNIAAYHILTMLSRSLRVRNHSEMNCRSLSTPRASLVLADSSRMQQGKRLTHVTCHPFMRTETPWSLKSTPREVTRCPSLVYHTGTRLASRRHFRNVYLRFLSTESTPNSKRTQ